MKYLIHVRWLLPAVLIGYVAWQALFASSTLTAETDFQVRAQYFDVLLPAGRVERTQAGIALESEPVYIDVRLPVRAKTAELEVVATAGSTPFKLGVQTGQDFAMALSEAPAEATAQGTVYRYRATDFPYLRAGHKLRFIISSPSLMPGSIVITHAHVSLERQAFSWVWLKERLAFSYE